MGAVLAAAIGFGAAGCETLDSFDMDFFNTKKKLPGDRKPVFPEGVPGVAQGVPAEYMKGYDEKAAQAAPDPAAAAAQQAASEKQAKPKPAAKPKPKPVTQRTQPAPEQTVSSPQPQPQAAWPTGPNPNQFSR
jgi:hypothetical protein